MGTILFFVVIGLGLAGFVLMFKYGAGPSWMWTGGLRDPVRNTFFRADGTWRRFGKLGIFITIGLLIASSFWL